jgi:hypothetical protein
MLIVDNNLFPSIFLPDLSPMVIFLDGWMGDFALWKNNISEPNNKLRLLQLVLSRPASGKKVCTGSSAYRASYLF